MTDGAIAIQTGPIQSGWRFTTWVGWQALREMLDLRTSHERAEDEAYEHAMLAGLTYDLEKLT